MTAVDERISPELVLVCPELAERARARLPSPPLDDVRPGDEISTPRLERLLAELALAVGDLTREQEAVVRRLEDVSELVNQISSNWEEVDRRLARLEHAVSRLESGAELDATRPDRERPLLVEDAPAARHRWPLLTGTLLFVGSLIAIMTVLELLPPFAETPRLGSFSGGALTSAQEPRSSSPEPDPEQVAPSTAAGPTVTGTRPSGEAQPEPSETPPPPENPTTTGTREETVPVAPQASRQPSAGTRTGTGAAAGGTNEFEPSRSFVWAPVKGAAFHSVTFLRGGKVVYTARVSQPRVVLPSTFRFTPGAYRWIVRTDTGPPSNTLGEPIVVSTFSVARR